MCLELATMMKIFPGVLVFVLIAYVILKHGGDGRALSSLTQSFVGLAVMVVVLLVSQILDETLPDCFWLLVSRAGDGMGVKGDVVTYVTVALTWPYSSSRCCWLTEWLRATTATRTALY